MRHAHSLAGRALNPDLTRKCFHAFGADTPISTHGVPKAAKGFTASNCNRITNHIGHSCGTRMCCFWHSRCVVVSQHDVFRANTHFLCRNLTQTGENTFTDLGHASCDLDSAAIVEFNPDCSAVHGGSAGNTVPTAGNTSSSLLHDMSP